MRRRPTRTPIVEKRLQPGELLERPPKGEGVSTAPIAPTSPPVESGHARRATPPSPPPTKLNRATLERALALRDELHRATDELNAKIAEAEAAIAELKLGVTGSVLITVDGDRSESLGWSRVGEKAWGMTYDVTTPRGTEKTPLRSASRAQRLRAVPYFAALVNELADVTVREIARVEAAREGYAAFAAAVDTSKGTP